MLKGFIIGFMTAWFIVGVVAYSTQNYVLYTEEKIYTILALPFLAVATPIVWAWAMVTNHNGYRTKFFKFI